MNNVVYDISFDNLITWLLPVKLRKALHFRWLQIMVKSIGQTHSGFLSFRDEMIYKMAHNSQVASIEEVLNDLFDPITRRIYIENATVREPVWFYEPEADKPVWFYEPEMNSSVRFYDPEYLSSATQDFTVFVPIDLQTGNTIADAQLQIEIEAQINYYKLFSKSYIIQYYE